MNAFEVMGEAAAASLEDRLKDLGPDDAVARFMLDRLTGAQVAAIVRAILRRPSLAARVTIRVPRELVEGEDLPETAVTDERTLSFRHSDPGTAALLIANTDDDQGTSLGELTLLGAKQLIDQPSFWVESASRGLGLPPESLSVWEAALSGLIAADNWSLQQIASFVALTRERIEEQSDALINALGWALPALQLPRDSGCFKGVRQKDLELPARWSRQFAKLIADRKPLLAKQRPSRQPIEPEELRTQFEAVRDEIPPHAHADIEAFIDAPPGWNGAAATLSQHEYEADGILTIFSGLRQKKTTLAEETLSFFEFELPDRLSDVERAYLGGLKERSVREPQDEDRDFFEAHREDLALNRALRAKWDKFILGRPIECADLLDGLLSAIERLYGQTSLISAQPRNLVIKSVRRTPGQWLDLNADVGRAFAVRYAGLPGLLGPQVTWDAPHLLAYEEEVIARAKRRKSKKYRKNESVSRASLQIKFDVSLSVGSGASAERNAVQVIWTGQPNAVGLELPGDLLRLAQRPLVRAEVARQPVSRKGALQSVALSDVGTLQPAFGQDSGSLTPRATLGQDVAKTFPAARQAAETAGRLSPEAVTEIDAAWEAFHTQYAAAITAWRTNGLATGAFFAQAKAYADLLQALRRHANTDVLRRDLWLPVLSVGCVQITGAAPSAIVAPWHPMRLAATAVKLHGVCGLIHHLLSAPEPNFGDARLFFADLRAELAHPYYPEICVGYAGSEPVLLTESDTVNDYSLMERPVRDASEAATDVDPGEAAREIRGLVERYIDLQPHERANLSIMLYNCDAAGLAMASVSALGAVQDQDEVQCNVLVRHRDRPKLAGVYTELLERAEGDPDAAVVSETSRNFMSKLRIGVMLDAAPATAAGEFRPVDIAFLHDVVSRQAKVGWYRVPAGGETPALLDHVPARWSYRRVTAEDELRATTYLACPRQSAEGWAYLDAVAAIFAQEPGELDAHYLPARQISFQDHEMKAMFDEAHGLAEWVATYDDLLDKRQLEALKIQVIRYRRRRTHGRNMVVSSTSELRVLHVLVRRRLDELSLGLNADRLDALARRLIDEASAISGDIVLRAAKQGVSAGELIGLVLSRALVAEELGVGRGAAWFLLDDYAEWLGQREQGLADILALAVDTNADGEPVLRVVVTEAKYVHGKTVGDARRKSKQQLRHTMQRMEEALFGDPGRLDRDLWLSRIADLLLDAVAALGSTARLEEVRDGVRAGRVPIDLRGYSHVFICGPVGEGPDDGEQEPLPDLGHGLQEVFSREGLRALLKAYEQGGDLSPLRAGLGALAPWREGVARAPAPRVSWVAGATPTAAPSVLKPLPVDDDDESGEEDYAPPPRVKTYDVSAEPEPAAVGARDTQPGAEAPREPVDSGPISAAPPTSREPVSAPVVPSTRIEPVAPGGGLAALVAGRAEAKGASAADLAWLEETSQKLRTALLGYSLQAKIVDTRLTPNAALVRFMGSDRLRVQDIEARQSALLTTHGLRLISVSPLPGEIVVGVARPQRQTVSLWDVWARRQLNRNPAGVNTSFVLGLRELDGEILYLNLGTPFGGAQTHEPHTLVAGATGSGKSVLIQALILDIAATNPSRLAQIHLIDPKMGVDYAALERLPHVQGGAVIEQARAIEVLQGLVVEMDRRYELFRGQGARDIRSYNMKAAPEARLPMVFLVHDEFAEWMLSEDYKEAVAANVSRLGVKARAAGIHLVFAAQRPDANVMPVQLRDNLGNRLILKVASVGTSEIALGQPGAEQLLGMGHLAARLSGEPAIVFAQAPFLSDDDIDAAVDAIIAGDAALLREVWEGEAA